MAGVAESAGDASPHLAMQTLSLLNTCCSTVNCLVLSGKNPGQVRINTVKIELDDNQEKR